MTKIIKRYSIAAPAVQTLNWIDDCLIDWAAAGNKIYLDGRVVTTNRRFSFDFDACKTSKDGTYAVLYQKLGTKGVILKNGDMVREINRSFYQSKVYEYPVEILEWPNQETLIIHCPEEYCKLEIENIETGAKIKTKNERKAVDSFYSRLLANDKYIINAGWVWHPVDVINVYAVEQVLTNMCCLDEGGCFPHITYDITSARFHASDQVIFSTGRAVDEEDEIIKSNSIGIYDLTAQKLIKQVQLNFDFGNVISIDDNYALDIFEYPKVINLNTGNIEEQFEDIDSGKQNSAILNGTSSPPIAIDTVRKRIAIANETSIDILEFG